jgi:hypothetical protein
MAVGSKTFPQEVSSQTEISEAKATFPPAHAAFGLGPGAQVVIGYMLLLTSLWTAMAANRLWTSVCGGIVLALTLASGYSKRELGLEAPSYKGARQILIIGLVASASILVIAVLAGEKLPVNPNWPAPRVFWQYAIWTMVQQFILQSFFYVRLESLVGARSAVFASALLFAGAHLPNPILTTGTLLAGLFFCQMFRCYRTVYPLGIVQAALGLSLAETVPDRWLHHMRVGIGYLHFHLH